MKCYECNIDVEPRAYPEGRCPSCDLSYTLPDEEFADCDNCGDNISGENGIEGRCLDCHIAKT